MVEGSIGAYCIQCLIAEGCMSAVYKAVHKDTNETVAVRAIPITALDAPGIAAWKNHIQRLSAVSSTHIVPLLSCERSPAVLYVISPFQGGGSLETLIQRRGPATETEAKPWLQSVLLALLDLRKAEIVHRSVKLSHVLLDERGAAKLTCALWHTDITGKPVSKLMHLAPEVLGKKYYDYKADVWSFGILAYRLLLATDPYRVSSVEALAAAQFRPITFSRLCALSADAKSLVQALLQYNASARPTYEEILTLPFFAPLILKNLPILQSSDQIKEPPAVDEKKAVIERNVELSPIRSTPTLLQVDSGRREESIGSSPLGLLAAEGNELEFSMIEIPGIEEDYSLVEGGDPEEPTMNIEDCKRLLPVAARYQSSCNFILARTIYTTCENVYMKEKDRGKKIMASMSMQSGYIENLMTSFDAKLQGIREELRKIGPGRQATGWELQRELETRLQLSIQCESSIRIESLEATLVLAKLAKLLAGDDQHLAEAVEQVEERCRAELKGR